MHEQSPVSLIPFATNKFSFFTLIFTIKLIVISFPLSLQAAISMMLVIKSNQAGVWFNRPNVSVSWFLDTA